MITQLTDKTEFNKFPPYLMVVTPNKLNKYLYSPFKWWKRYLLESNGISLMDENLSLNNIMFHNNDKKYNTIYKKMKINDKIIYIPIEEYSKFYLDHKIKISTSIVEMLGVFSIDYHYSELATELFTVTSYAEYSNVKIDNNISSNTQNNIKNNDFKLYHKSNCPYLFLKPIEFEDKIKNNNAYFMDKDEYDNDFDIQNLVRSRLDANLTEYTLKYEIDFMNNFEIGLASKFYAGLGLDIKKNYHKKLNVSLNIHFFRKRDLINSENMRIDNNNCLQLILVGPSPPNYYESLLQLVRIKKNDVQPSEEYNVEKQLLPINNSTNYILLFNFIEKYIEEKYKHKDDNDDYESYYSYYNFIKIAKQSLLETYMSEVRNLDDLDKNGIFFLKLRSTGFASLITFDDEGLDKLQKIYLNIFRQYSDIEKLNESNSPHLKRIYIYIIRVFNNACPNSIIIFDKDIDQPLRKILFNIIINIVVIPNFNIFQQYVITEINKYKHEQILHISKKDYLSLLV
jgi:hypothetical protein